MRMSQRPSSLHQTIGIRLDVFLSVARDSTVQWTQIERCSRAVVSIKFFVALLLGVFVRIFIFVSLIDSTGNFATRWTEWEGEIGIRFIFFPFLSMMCALGADFAACCALHQRQKKKRKKNKIQKWFWWHRKIIIIERGKMHNVYCSIWR